jgi:DNA-directed RNA polymerase specialized sigma24 family protein
MKNMNQKIEEAMKSKDITNIMHRASRSFCQRLDKDIIYTCQINALWKALSNFNPSKNTKFTTYLYRGVVIECLKEIKFLNKSRYCNGKLHENIQAPAQDLFVLQEILDELKDEEEKDLITQKLENKTINEIAKTKPYSRETARKKINHIFDKLRDKFCE